MTDGSIRPSEVMRTIWKLNSFRKSAEELEGIASEKKTVYMCAEALWWRCHRSMVSDWLKLKGWKVFHIMGAGKSEEHRYTQPARIVNGNLLYSKE